MAKSKLPKPPAKKLRKEFFTAFAGDNVEAIAKYLDDGLDVNTMFQLDFDEPALAWALDRKRCPMIARLLLDRGADVKLASPKGVTALHTVEEAAFATELLDRGADVNARDAHDRTPLHQAAAGKHADVVAVLIARGAELEAIDKDGNTPYASASHVKIRVMLREAGAKPFGPGGGKALAVTVVEHLPRSAVAVDRGAIGCDRDGNTWFWGYGGGGGLVRFDGKKLTKLQFAETLAISDIAPGPPGVVYFGTNWGLLRFAKGDLRLYSSTNSELFDNHIVFMATNPDGHAYTIHYESEVEEKHISVFDGETFRVLEPGKDFPLGMELICIRFDRNGEPILCGRGGYALKRDGAWVKTNKIDRDSPYKQRLDTTLEKWASTAVYDAVDDGEALWISTQDGVFEMRGRAVTKHEMKGAARRLCKDVDTMWAALNHGGLARIRAGKVTVFDQKTSVLPHDDIAGITRAADGAIWVHTGGGVVTVRNDELRRFE